MDKRARASSNAIDQKGRPPIRELVWQIGNPEQGYGCLDQTDESRTKIKEMLLECQEIAEQRYKNLAWGDLDFHADEVSYDADGKVCGSLHLHSSFVPLCSQNKQGPKVQVALERSLKEMGFDSFEAWKHDLDDIMETVLERHGLKRVVMNNNNKHQESTEFHRQQKVKKQTKIYEERRAAAEYALNLSVNEVDKRFEEAVKQSLDENIHRGAGYENIAFFVSECPPSRFYELNQEAEEFKKALLPSAVNTSDIKDNLDTLIKEINNGKKLVSWEQRQQLWDKYNTFSPEFWELRKELGQQNKVALSEAYDQKRAAWQMYSDAEYLLWRSRGVISLLAALVMVAIASARQKAAMDKINELKREQSKLMRKTAAFKSAGNSFREELKKGTIPHQKYLDIMEDIVRFLDEESKQRNIQIVRQNAQSRSNLNDKDRVNLPGDR
jgi:hypothetical protein